ncbi:MAG: hemolysin family protein [Bacillota bacterium]|nr:hemolysin family protein [Bacillota bacterium]
MLFIYAFVNATEAALLSLNDKRIEDMESENKGGVKTLKKLMDVSNRYTVTVKEILVILSVTITVLSLQSAGVMKFIEFFKKSGFVAVGYIFTVLIISAFIMLVGELIPRKIAAAHYEGYASAMAGAMKFIYICLLPLTLVLEGITSIIVILFGVDPKTSVGEVTEEGILSIVDEGEENGVIDEDEGEMINSIIEFGDTTAQKIMTHRTEVIALPVTASFHDIVSLATDEHFSRIPIYDGTLDNIIGVLHIRALIKYIEKVSPGEFNLTDILNEPYFVPQSKKANDLLRELQNEKTHMAIVIDEYGGTAGIITMEDLIEFVFGNIQDEFDEEEENDTEKVDEKTYIVDGAADFESTLEEIGLKLTKDEWEEKDYEKMAGFVMGELDRIPVKGDKVEFKGYTFEVLAVCEKRIEKIKITVPDEEDENKEE